MVLRAEDVDALKREIREGVAAALKTFEQKSGGLTPAAIDIEMRRVSFGGSVPPEYVLGDVNLDFKL